MTLNHKRRERDKLAIAVVSSPATCECKLGAVMQLRLAAHRDYNRPLSRRLDRCDRMIQNEGHDSRKLFTLKKALCR